MGGALGKKVNEIAADFNASQSEFEIKPVYKGSYAETMTSAIAAFRAKEQPAIVQVFEVGTATMMGAEKAIYPVYQLMNDTKEQGFYAKNPGTDTAVLQMISTEPTENSKGIRFGNFLQTRDIINEELEAVWAGKATAQAALNNAVRRGDERLRRFERTQK